MTHWLRCLVLLLPLLAGTAPAQAQKSADTLRITWRNAIPDVDPYYNSLRTGLVVAHQAWDCLVDRDPDTFLIKPLLASNWRAIDDVTLEFTLRSGVTFHDGSPFSADDVVYTINTVLSDKQVAVPSNFLYLAGAEKIDDLHVRIKLKRVFPAALEYLAMTLPIWPQAYRERIGADAYAKAPVGTGPYRITRVDGASEIDMERYDGYFPGSPKGRPAIRHIVIQEVPDASTEFTSLMGGRTDWIWNFNPDQYDQLGAMPTIQTMRAESMRIDYLGLDAAGRSGAGNPLTNQKVREAIFHAIDRPTIARQLVQGGARPLDAPCFPTQFGCDPQAAAHYSYDPALARKLLAEAGYPAGFDTELVTYSLPQWAGAVQNYLKAVGINAHITQLQVGAAVARQNAGTAPLYLGSWGSYSINDVSAILPYYFAGGDADYTRDPTIESLVERGGATTDTDERRKFYSDAIHLITTQADWMPLFTEVTNYAFSRTLNFKPYPDELPRFYLSSWK
jgi:peptide/nickel transport system substrate-binding protein